MDRPVISPELALVDAQLAREARELLPEPGTPWWRETSPSETAVAAVGELSRERLAAPSPRQRHAPYIVVPTPATRPKHVPYIAVPTSTPPPRHVPYIALPAARKRRRLAPALRVALTVAVVGGVTVGATLLATAATQPSSAVPRLTVTQPMGGDSRSTAPSTTNEKPAPKPKPKPEPKPSRNEAPKAKPGARTAKAPKRVSRPHAQPGIRLRPTVALPPLVWAPAHGARTYRVELWRGGKRVLVLRKSSPRVQLPKTWRYGKRTFRLTAGSYVWVVKPGRIRGGVLRFGKPIVHARLPVKSRLG